ncbi:MAG: energy-coupling factor transporter transmembrane protein EcfT [Clostridium sp.]|nr:energy-coupling factor transporter transmembrane protein EcfT [Clostridium sp.]
MEQYHPVVNFIFFCAVIGFGMFWNHPLCLIISLVSAGIYTVLLFGWKRAGRGMSGLLGLMAFTALLNPAFSHQGVTVLAYLPTGNVLTLESVCYGIGAGCMLGAVLLWFRCMNEVITSDKIVYLFGRTFPVLGLLLSTVLGFIPKMQRKLSEIRSARRYSSRQEQGMFQSRMQRIKHGMENLSLLVTWALEDAVETADSMKGRGYGLEGRTVFAVYRFSRRDRRMCAVLGIEFFYLAAAGIFGGVEWNYYPYMEGAGFGIYSISVYLVYFVMCLTPVFMELFEERRWNRLKSAI